MKFSEQWLREWANPAIDTEALVAQLTMAGLEVDGVAPAAPDFEKVVVAQVIKTEKHPDADKLTICQVDAGLDEPLQIVCGASNVRQDLRIPCALVGAKLPGDFKIKRAKLRGVASAGMLCSAVEIGLAEEADGLFELPQDAPVGQSIREYLQLDDNIIDVDLTPNRSDCLSIAGVAREVGVLNSCDVTEVTFAPVAVTLDEQPNIQIDAAEHCPSYTGRIVRGLNPQAATPIWMQERLRRAGVRSLGPLVDVTNYVMLELGQPMHAFDLRQIDGGIVVRQAKTNEKLTLLGGEEITLTSDCTLIADYNKALALAGVMGGQHSGVADDTTDVLLENAFFKPESIAGKARQFGLHTESSHRFERGVDPELQTQAIERATQLLIDIAGGQAGPVITQKSTVAAPPAIKLRHARVTRVLGVELAAAQIEEIFVRLGMQINPTDEGWNITPASARFDIQIEADLIEELARVYGYNNIPTHNAMTPMRVRPQPEAQTSTTTLRQMLVQRGYQEAITYSFVAPAWQQTIVPDQPAIDLTNPISNDLAQMRTSLWPGLLNALNYNVNRQQKHLKLFEIGLRFITQDDELKQINTMSGLLYGTIAPEQWGQQETLVDFYDLKADLAPLLACADQDVQFVTAQNPALHPGQTAQIYVNNQAIGWLGTLHPQHLKALDLPRAPVLFELDVAPLQANKIPHFAPVSRFPAIRRDLAILVDEAVSAEKIRQSVFAVDSHILQDVLVFDVYRGGSVETGLKSIALGLILQDYSATLRDEVVDSLIADITRHLRDQLAATIRDS